ncbi:MAG: PA domain-containing protein [Anaerolineae bacterium]|nr:PA domain-containing protein [Anaerolineae bacterium]
MHARIRQRFRLTGLLLLTLSLVILASLARAHDGVVTDDPNQQEHEILAHFSDEFLAEADATAFVQGHGGDKRPARSRNVSVVGQLSFDEAGSNTTNTDVWALGNFAYVGTFSSPACAGDLGLGVKIVDISDPTAPQWIGDLASPSATRANDVKVASLDTTSFTGDLLVHSNEPCRAGGDGGIRLYDVSDPYNPIHLADYYAAGSPGPGPGPTAFGVHNAYLYSLGDRAYILVVANISPDLYDFRIVDATDPANPIEAGRWSATVSPDAPPGLEPRGTSRSLGIHDVWASQNGKTAYLSYWDAGYILLDISDPTNPRFLGNSPWAPGDEGNAHAAVPARGGNLMLATDEDFSSTGLGQVAVHSGPHSGETYDAVVGAISPSFSPLTADIAWVGLGDTERDSGDDPTFGCLGGQPYGESVAGKIALIQRGFCAFSDKVNRAESEGAVGVIIFNNVGEALVLMGGTPVNIPAVFIQQSRGERLAADREAGELVNVTMSEGVFDGWGYARIFDISNPSDIRLLSTITLPSTFDQSAPNPFGVHNVITRGNTAYFSWYADGLVVVDFSQPAAPQVIAEYNDGNNFWGVYVQGDLIFASDRNNGLWIFKLAP